jgi:hypothetical protein
MAERKQIAKRTGTKATTRRKKVVPAPTQQEIAERAYHLWLAGGADPLANWLAAERELAAA